MKILINAITNFNLLFLVCFSFSTIIKAQNYKFKRLGIEDGLSQITVSDIFQDEKSRIWIATLDGLNCFDGKQIKIFNNLYNDTISYGNLYVTQIVGDNNGNLYLLSSTGLFQFNLKTEKYRLLDIAKPTALCGGKDGILITSDNKIFLSGKDNNELEQKFANIQLPLIDNNIIQDSLGNIWLGLKDGGVISIDNKGTVKSILTDVKIMKFFESRDNNIWIGTQKDGVFCFSIDGNLVKHYKIDKNNPKSLRNDLARALCQDLEGNIWVGYRSGLSKIEVSSGRVFHYDSAQGQIGGLSHQSITSLFTDKQGMVWIGTYWGGVNIFDPHNQRYRYFTESTDELSFSVVSAISEDLDNNIWICTEGRGLNCYNPKTDRFERFNMSTGHNFSSDYLKDIKFDKKRNCLWIATDFSTKINRFDIGTRKLHVYDLYKDTKADIHEGLFSLADTDSKLLIGTTNSIISFDKESMQSDIIFYQKNLFTHNYNSLMLDSKSRLWFATDEGCTAYYINENRFENYSISLRKNIASKKELINVFFEDAKGQIWMGTHGTGLFLLDEETLTFDMSLDVNLLSGDNIRALCETKNGKLLIGTGHGLSVYDECNNTINNYNSQTGFPLTFINRKSLFLSSDEQIYLGSSSGMVVFDERYLEHNIEDYDLQLSHLYVNNEEITIDDKTGILTNQLQYTDAIVLNNNHKFFSIGYSTDNYIHTDKDEIIYRLLGYSDDWNVNRSGNDITYTNLAPGKYVFEIGFKKDYKAVRRLEIRILPPFYATWWAFVIYGCIVITILFFVIKEYRLRLYLKASLAFEQREKKYIEETNQSKLRFFTNISHEIRTPITLILAQIEILINSGKLPRYTYLKLLNVHKNADKLKTLINELLDFRKQEQGAFQLKITQFDINELLEEYYNLFNELAVSRNIVLSLNNNNCSYKIWADKLQIQKVINNLLSNAFKYTADGGNINIELKETDEECLIYVSDNGLGISEVDLSKIFERFYQVDNIGQYGGTGIGLALCQNIINAHQGSISVESKIGNGSCFKVSLKKGNNHYDPSIIRNENIKIELPVINTKERELSAEIRELIKDENFAQHESKLLIIDDDEDIRDLLVEIFSSLYIVETAYNGKDGYAKIKTMQPDLVISDVMMPEMSGIELCSKIKNHIETSHIPIILLTAKGDSEQEFEGLKIGADCYISKPFDTKKLITQCNNLINVRRALQKKYAHQSDIKSENLATNGIDKKFIEKATAIIEQNLENTEFNVDTFSKSMGVSRTILFQKIKGITGTTPNNLIMNLRLKRAAFLIENMSELNMTDIAYQLGFGNPQYFNKCFKELFGMSPSAYKKMHHAENQHVKG